jgi:hypothetical protein
MHRVFLHEKTSADQAQLEAGAEQTEAAGTSGFVQARMDVDLQAQADSDSNTGTGL